MSTRENWLKQRYSAVDGSSLSSAYRVVRDVAVLSSLFVLLMNQALILEEMAARGALSASVWTGLELFVTVSWVGVMIAGVLAIAVVMVKVWGVLNG